MRKVLVVYILALVASAAASWDGGIGEVVRAWVGVTLLALLLLAWWIFSIEAYRPGIRVTDGLGRVLHTGDRVTVPEAVERTDGVVVPGPGWKISRIHQPRVRVADERGRTSDWVLPDDLYVKQGKQRLALEDPSPQEEVYARRRLTGEPDRLAANAPLLVVEVRAADVTLVDASGRKIDVPAEKVRKV